MVWDLRGALLRKEEFESARLMDFEFRQRVRTTRLLARELGLDEAELIRDAAVLDEVALLQAMATAAGKDPQELAADFARCLARARAELIGEIGDPTPHRLG